MMLLLLKNVYNRRRDENHGQVYSSFRITKPNENKIGAFKTIMLIVIVVLDRSIDPSIRPSIHLIHSLFFLSLFYFFFLIQVDCSRPTPVSRLLSLGERFLSRERQNDGLVMISSSPWGPAHMSSTSFAVLVIITTSALLLALGNVSFELYFTTKYAEKHLVCDWACVCVYSIDRSIDRSLFIHLALCFIREPVWICR